MHLAVRLYLSPLTDDSVSVNLLRLELQGGVSMSSNLLKYLSTAPVIATVWMVITAGIVIEFNRFFPDLLLHP